MSSLPVGFLNRHLYMQTNAFHAMNLKEEKFGLVNYPIMSLTHSAEQLYYLIGFAELIQMSIVREQCHLDSLGNRTVLHSIYIGLSLFPHNECKFLSFSMIE
jgi:hypothetical protein